MSFTEQDMLTKALQLLGMSAPDRKKSADTERIENTTTEEGA